MDLSSLRAELKALRAPLTKPVSKMNKSEISAEIERLNMMKRLVGELKPAKVIEPKEEGEPKKVKAPKKVTEELAEVKAEPKVVKAKAVKAVKSEAPVAEEAKPVEEERRRRRRRQIIE